MAPLSEQSKSEQLKNQLKQLPEVVDFRMIEIAGDKVGFILAKEKLKITDARKQIKKESDLIHEMHIILLSEQESLPNQHELGKLHLERSRRRAPYAPPEGDTERYLSALWSDRLGVDRVGRDDDFFRLGGHSMLAVQVRLDVDRDTGTLLAAESFFKNGKLHQLASAIDREKASN